MTLALSFDEAKSKFKRHPERGVAQTPFFGSRDNPNLPLATLNEQDPGRRSSTHFHVVDQFQLVLEGGGTLGKHALAPASLHFSRAYTPYGPLIADAQAGLKFFVMRPHPDTGSQRLPKERAQLERVPASERWQVTRQVEWPASGDAATLAPVPGVADDHGLAAYTLTLEPHAHIEAPDPANGDGQYLAAVRGSLIHEGKEYAAPALIFVWPGEGAQTVQAGAQGLAAMVLNFPRPHAMSARSVMAASGFRKYQCQLCAFSYDEALGMPEEGIAPGTRWEDVPETWSCPDCSASKADFQMIAV
jgi:rubredoxin